MKVDTLKQKLQAASSGTFSLAAADLGLAGVEDLLKTHLGGTLTVNGARPDLAELSVEGTGTVDSLRDRPVKVWFSADADADNVTGLLIAYQAGGWVLDTAFLKFEGDYLRQYSRFTSLALALSARPEDATEKKFGVGVGVYVSVDGRPLLLHACLPAAELKGQKSDIIIRGDFSGISLGDLDKLAGFVTGYSFNGLLPTETIPLADEFLLRSARFVINPNLKFITAVGLEVRSARPWVLIKDKFEFDYLDISFMINTPGASSTVYWGLTSEMRLGGSVKVITGIDSDLSLSAELADPVPIKPILSRYYPAADLDVTVEGLRIELDFADKPFDWYVYLDVDGTWNLFGDVAAEEVKLSASGQGASPEHVQLDGRLALGDAEFFLGGEMNKGAGWDFSGRMTHAYNVELVPNPDFKPGTPGSDPLKVEHVAKNSSHFFQTIFDKLFTGGGSSGVPPMLDVDIKTLSVRFNTQTKDFHFDTDIDFGEDVEAVLTFSSLHQSPPPQQAAAQTPTFEKRATGLIRVFPDKPNEFAFDLGLDLKPGSKHFVALYNNTSGNAIKLGDLVRAMFPDSPAEVPDFSINIKDAIVGYVSAQQGDQTVSNSVFALDMGATIDLTSLGEIPLIGQSLSAAKTLKLAFQLLYPALAKGVQTFAKDDLKALNDLITVTGPKFPADQDLPSLTVKTELRIGDGPPIDFKLPVAVDSKTGQLTSTGNSLPPPPNAQPTDDGVSWFQLNTQFGPVHLERAGFKFDNGEVTALLEGGLTALGLEVDLMGLSVKSRITDVENGEFKPEFGLRGLGLSFSKGGVGFAGALLHLDGQAVDEYDGLASVEAEGLRLAALGTLAEVKGQTSLFLYAVLDYPLGGAPFFYVTGLAGGFGLNQKLVMPPPEHVPDFPLIAAAQSPPAVPTDPNAARSFITHEMDKLHDYLTPSIGQYFGCAGVRFTSFKLLDSFVLVSISFGREFELDLLGLSTLVVPPELPPGEPPLARVSLQIVASFIPSEGLAIVQGRLTTDSYILDPNCHLTGGFAFATWFGPNPNAGDFVITLGGYHPDFQKPDHYPAVPRVGINWQIINQPDKQLSVTGGLYFALTPRALMAGGAMRAVFQTSLDLGIATVDVKAWFIIGADFIVYWKPFRYSAHLYIDIGIDVVIHFLGTHDIGLDAGADLQVWGPPFGGHAHVFVKIIGIKIGFDVDFGATAPKPPLLEWDDAKDSTKSFRQSFLPPDDQIVSVAIGEGFVRKVEVAKAARLAAAAAPGGGEDGAWYVINPKDLCVRTSSVIPIKECVTAMPQGAGQGAASDPVGNTDFGIASMGKGSAQVKTFHQLVVTRDENPAEALFSARPIRQHVPGGLWATANSDDVNADRLIEDAVVGFEIVPVKTSTLGPTEQIERRYIDYTPDHVDGAFADHDISKFNATKPNPGDDPGDNLAIWDSIQGEIHANTKRDAILAAVGFSDADLDIGEPFSAGAAYAPSYGSLLP